MKKRLCLVLGAALLCTLALGWRHQSGPAPLRRARETHRVVAPREVHPAPRVTRR